MLLNNGPQEKNGDPGESDMQRSCKGLPLTEMTLD